MNGFPVPLRNFDIVAETILEFGRLRERHFDEEVGTDGPFSMILRLYACRENTGGVPLSVVFDSVNSGVSTSTYLLERLIDWRYVERILRDGSDYYRLVPSRERMVEGYLRDCEAYMSFTQSALL